MKKLKSLVEMMDQSFFNRMLHLVNARPQQGKRMIGLGSTALWELWQRVSERVREGQHQRRNEPDRKRQAGGGRKKDAEVLCRLLVTLLYLRQHWTMQALAETIGCAESTVWNYIHEMLPYLRTELPASLLEQWQQECDSVERAELEEWLAELPEGTLLVDTWEHPIPRPSDHDVQKGYYSGKQADHTRKNQLISLPNGTDIVDVVLGEKGPRSDSKLFEQTQSELPETLEFTADKAYVGRRNTTTPFKRPPGGQLTPAQKDFNRLVSQKRVYVEHLIRVIKIFRIAKEEFRMRSGMYEMAIGCVCGLVRLRVQYV
ncbi:MAG: transposase family protein [Elainellaceae cyanobacterium]